MDSLRPTHNHTSDNLISFIHHVTECWRKGDSSPPVLPMAFYRLRPALRDGQRANAECPTVSNRPLPLT